MNLNGRRVFILEDNLENRIVYQIIFVHEGIIYEFDRWGRNTIERLKNFAPVDLIILDLMLPNNISGFDVFDQLRKDPKFETTPIIAVSASDPSSTIPKLQEKGFDGFIAKPIENARFVKQLAQILDGEPIWDSGLD